MFPPGDFPGKDLIKSLDKIQEESDYWYSYTFGDVPPEAKPPKSKPECVLWLERVDRYGLPCPGAYVDQPYYFMMAIEAARRGKSFSHNRHRRNLELRRQRNG